MSDHVEVNANDFFDFIGAPGPVVMFLSFHPAQPYNRALYRHLRERGDGVSLGTASMIELLASGSLALPYLSAGLESCGVATPVGALPGYYLFQGGRLLAWDAGLPTSADVDAIFKGSLVGVFAFLVTSDAKLLAKAMRMATDEATAARLASRFWEAFERRPSDEPRRRATGDRSRAGEREEPEDELSRAYRTLGVQPTATDQEVEAAWRELRIKLHPDLAAGDPEEFQRRSRFAAALNRARDIIRAHRARARA